MCAARGATVIGTVSSDEKARVSLAHGVSHAIVYTREDTVARVMEITGGRGVQAASDGGGQATLDTSRAALGRRGRLISFGGASGPIASLDISRLTRNSVSLMRPALYDYTRTQAELEALAKHVFGLMLAGQLKPTVHKVYPLEEAAQAQDDLAGGQTIGKLLLKL